MGHHLVLYVYIPLRSMVTRPPHIVEADVLQGPAHLRAVFFFRGSHVLNVGVTLWLFNIAMENHHS